MSLKFLLPLLLISFTDKAVPSCRVSIFKPHHRARYEGSTIQTFADLRLDQCERICRLYTECHIFNMKWTDDNRVSGICRLLDGKEENPRNIIEDPSFSYFYNPVALGGPGGASDPGGPLAPGKPRGPFGPGGPSSPGDPAAPGKPLVPVDPVRPFGPVAPIAPIWPGGPATPVAPEAPVSPVRPEGPGGPVAPTAPRLAVIESMDW
ncbi:hypothetical protein LSH36_1327g00015 [Paralvinella palmiformis]|uniref:Apple domain-containing protein n=1 Tax=Paralvinella palmiformis TaxID=53620 RepID=A0AAD9IUI4_9ANNE|nr:hypothetical protein LSH36_1327g00015 [Paralvinella palmiformis]